MYSGAQFCTPSSGCPKMSEQILMQTLFPKLTGQSNAEACDWVVERARQDFQVERGTLGKESGGPFLRDNGGDGQDCGPRWYSLPHGWMELGGSVNLHELVCPAKLNL